MKAMLQPIKVDEERLDSLEFNNMEPKFRGGSLEKSLYGWCRFNPKCIQCLNKPWFFLVCCCWVVFGQSLSCNGLNNSVLSTIEKRYGFSTFQIGIFSTTFNIMVGTLAPLVCYVGGKHRPRTLAVGGLVLAIGLLVLTLPHVISPAYKAGVIRDGDTCAVGASKRNTTSCEKKDSFNYFGMFIFGHALNGLGDTPMYTLSYAHINEVASKERKSFYLGMITLAGMMGPALGFILGNFMLKTYVDIKQPLDSLLTPLHTQWVGAWWMAYAVGSIALFTAVLPLLGFPSTFDAPEKNRKCVSLESIVESSEKQDEVKTTSALNMLLPSTKKLLKKWPYLFLTLSVTADSLVVSGFATFLPKFIETQFHFPASKASLYVGYIYIPGVIGGVFAGAYACKKFDWNATTLLRNASVVSFVGALFGIVVLLGCSNREIVGLNVSYNTSSSLDFANICNLACHCTGRYKPVCSEEDQLTFFSPCHAGCSSFDQNQKIYGNCTCLKDQSANQVTMGRCLPECKFFPLFAIAVLGFMLCYFFNNVPVLTATFKIVPVELVSYAMGVQQVFVRFLGSVPSPSIFGKLIDNSCVLWATHSCTGERTECLEYDNVAFRKNIVLLGGIGKAIAVFFLLLAYISHRKSNEKHEQSSHLELQNVS